MDMSIDHAVTEARLTLGGLHRRGFLRIGGIAIASAAIFAACGSDDDESASTADEAVDAAKDEVSDRDITVLRTASSLELVAVQVYQTAIDSGLLATAAIKSAAELFQKHHNDHAELFQGATKEVGGEVVEEPNAAVLGSLQPRLGGLTDERAVAFLAYDVEVAVAATYFSSAGTFAARRLNQTAMAVGGIEARHAAVLAAIIGQPQVPRVFQTADGAIAPGTGL